MSLQTLLMPAITAWWLSPQRQQQMRARAERARQRNGQRHTVHYFHQTDDPYSALMLQALPRFLQRYEVDLQTHLVSPPADDAAPDRARLVAYSRRDATWLAQHYGLRFADPGAQPAAEAVQQAGALLARSLQTPDCLDQAAAATAWLWHPASAGFQPPATSAADAAELARAQAHGDALRHRLGHYAGAMLYYAGEWYWGLDRLHHLEARLQALGALRAGAAAAVAAAPCLFPPEAAARWPQAAAGTRVDFFFSLRSPYSAIAAERVFALVQGTGIDLRLRYVLPMVMRGLAVPRSKRMYISQDAAREARRLGVPFGRICDPVGRPTERGLALMPLAERQGRARDYVLSFMRGVWAEGLDAGSDRGLRSIATRAGLDWNEACSALQDEGWRATAEANRLEMLQLGLWGVPSFQAGSTAVWGQDRLDAVAQALRAGPQAAALGG